MEHTENKQNIHEAFHVHHTYNSEVTTSTTAKIMKNRNEYPVGYRFCPYDYELIIAYLGNKITNNPLPHQGIIDDIGFYEHTPDQLADMFDHLGEDIWYFFTPREKKYMKGTRPKRGVAEYGYWKAAGNEVHISDNHGNIVGKKRALSFYEGKQPKGVKTHWRIYEYTANPSIFPPPQNNVHDNKSMRLDDWVLCKLYKIYEKKENGGDNDTNDEASSNNPSTSTNDFVSGGDNYNLEGGGIYQASSSSSSSNNFVDPDLSDFNLPDVDPELRRLFDSFP